MRSLSVRGAGRYMRERLERLRRLLRGGAEWTTILGLLGWSGQPLVKYLAIVAVSGLVSWGLARALAATALTRLLFGIKSERPGIIPGRSQTSRSV
jgi:hypothetical protein